jgi:hypothetical protein
MESGGAISTAVMAAGDKRVRVVLEVTEFFKKPFSIQARRGLCPGGVIHAFERRV